MLGIYAMPAKHVVGSRIWLATVVGQLLLVIADMACTARSSSILQASKHLALLLLMTLLHLRIRSMAY